MRVEKETPSASKAGGHVSRQNNKSCGPTSKILGFKNEERTP